MAAVLEKTKPGEIPAGGAFLLAEVGSTPVFTAESLTEEQRLYHRTALQFLREKVMPRAAALENKDFPLMRELIRAAGELGFIMVDIPEAYGGLSLDVTTSMLIAEANASLGSWSVSLGAQTGIGTLPIVWFGNAAQKQKYLPKLATGEWVSAYALTETGSGSDALGARTRATLSADKKHWVLNGSKQYITNAAFADVFVVFAKVDGEKFTGFIVEKGTPGFTVGPEEHKVGIRGSSTCPLIFEDAKVPVENLLGEVGKGHKIAFNILNHGRLKLGVGALGSMKSQIRDALAYAQDRKQFNTPIVQFGLIREKFARMVATTYAVESMAYRTVGLIDARLAGVAKDGPDHDALLIAAIEEYAVESSILKVTGSEAMGTVNDDAVQIHGGYGFIEDYSVARVYRDSRIYRIFEGTNEINRMLITGMLLKRTLKGALPLFAHAQAVSEELASGKVPKATGTDALAGEAQAAEALKRLAVYATQVAAERFGPELEAQQQVLAAISDVIIDAYALDSAVTRARQAKAAGAGQEEAHVAAVKLYAQEAVPRAFQKARRALAGASPAGELASHLKKIAPLEQLSPQDPVALTEAVMRATVEKSGYPFSE